MTTPEYPVPQQTLKPNDEQKQRLAARRRFNWLYVYTPLILLSLVCLVLIGLLIYGVLSPSISGTAEFASALADIVIILTVIPLLLLCALPTLLFVGVVAYRRQTRQEKEERGEAVPEHGRVQRLFWWIDNLLDQIQAVLQKQTPRLARPIISFNALLAYLKTFWTHIKALFVRNE